MAVAEETLVMAPGRGDALEENGEALLLTPRVVRCGKTTDKASFGSAGC